VSELTFTSLKRPPYSRSRRSMSGPSTLQGSHHGAQKSTTTGTSMEASMTSRSNDDRVVSIMDLTPPARIDARALRAVSTPALEIASDALGARGRNPPTRHNVGSGSIRRAKFHGAAAEVAGRTYRYRRARRRRAAHRAARGQRPHPRARDT